VGLQIVYVKGILAAKRPPFPCWAQETRIGGMAVSIIDIADSVVVMGSQFSEPIRASNSDPRLSRRGNAPVRSSVSTPNATI
jgi:hypothetical protein